MESEVDYDAYMDVLAEENREFLTTIPPDQIAEYLCTFENWQQYLPSPLEPPSAIELAESISISHINDLAYILAFEYPKTTQELREELDYYHKGCIMQILLEGQEALDYLIYMQEQVKSIDEATKLMARPMSANLPSVEEIAEPNSEKHVVQTEADLARDIISDILQPREDTRQVSNQFPSIKPKRTYYKWNEGDIHTLHACALSPRPSIRNVAYIHSRFDTSKVSEQAVRSKLNALGYKIKKGTVCLQD